MHRTRPRWAWAFPALFVFILGLSLVADLALLGFDGAVFAGYDKPLHFLLYACCGLGAVGWFHRHAATRVIIVVAALVLLEELSQGLFPRRSVDMLDAIASLAGVIAGGAMGHLLRGGSAASRDVRCG